MSELQLASFIAYITIIVLSIKPVIGQLKEAKIQHLVFGTAASVAVLWWFRTGIYDGLEIHFLWLTALTLILGWRWAFFSSAISIVLVSLIDIIHWQDIGLYGLLGNVVPITFTYLAYTFAFKHLPRHFFVYTFFCSFFIGAMSMALKMFVMGTYFSTLDVYNWDIIIDNYLILIPLLLFPEGLLNGMTMTILVIYKPEWVKTFYDSQYLDGK
jgi:uncharacterized membrane protein